MRGERIMIGDFRCGERLARALVLTLQVGGVKANDNLPPKI
jgi:hypothetical protein